MKRRSRDEQRNIYRTRFRRISDSYLDRSCATNLEEIMITEPCERSCSILNMNVQTDIYIPQHDITLLRIIAKSAKFAGRSFHDKEPLLDARLPDGSRLNATYESVTLSGHTVTIRKFTHSTLSLPELIKNGTLSTELAAFLWLMCEGMNAYPMNIIITGGSGTGKTTLLNALAAVIRYRDRIVTIEDTTELKFLHRDNWISLESRPASSSAPAVTMDDLLQNSLRMRPDRLILGKCAEGSAHVVCGHGHRIKVALLGIRN